MNESKYTLIDEILANVEFECLTRWLERMRIDRLVQDGVANCTKEEWGYLIKKHNVTPYSVAKEVVRLMYDLEEKEHNNCSIDSAKAEIYDIGKDRAPAVKHIIALQNVLYRETNIINKTSGIIFARKVDKALSLSTAIMEYFQIVSDMPIVSSEMAREKLSQMDIDTLTEIHRQFTSNEWESSSDDVNDNTDSVFEYLMEVPFYNLFFINENFSTLLKYRERIEYIAKILCCSDNIKLKDIKEQLEKKRLYGKIPDCYIKLCALEYDLNIEENDKERLVKEIEEKIEKNFEMLPMILCIGQFNHLMWDTLLLLMKHYDKYPQGAKVDKWLAKTI